MVAEVNGPNYKRDEFLTTLKSLKDSVDDNSKLEQTELKAIYDCLKESSTFLKKLANPGTNGADSDADSDFTASFLATYFVGTHLYLVETETNFV